MRFKTKITVLVLIVGLVIGLWPGRSSAATGLIYISPSSTSVQVGSDVTVGLRINPGTSVNAVQATVSYDASSLQFVSTAVSAFPTCTQNTGGGGAVTLSCAILGSSTSSDSLIANITFQALAGSGSTSLQISNANAANNGSWTNPSTSGGSVSFTSPAPAPGPAPTAPTTTSGSSSHTSSTSSSHSSASTAAAPAAAPAPTATTPTTPTAANIKLTSTVKAVGFNTATITASTNVASQVYVKYGTDKQNLDLSTSPTGSGKTATISLDPSKLTPGTTYYYQVIASDSSGNLAKSTIKSFVTEGYTLSVTILDSQNHPVASKLVTLHSKPTTVKTDSHGIATFTNVAPGLHHVEYSDKSHTYSQTVYVTNNFVSKGGRQTAAPQSAAVILAGYKQPGGLPKAVVIPLLVVLIGAGILFFPRTYLIRSKRLLSRNLAHGKPTDFFLNHGNNLHTT